MLVLTRKAQEKIRIGKDITVTVIKTKGKGVRLGIEAPDDVTVLRGELIASSDSFAGETPSAPNEATSDESGNVRFARAERGRVGTVLPEVLGEPGPLREMLLSRQGATA